MWTLPSRDCVTPSSDRTCWANIWSHIASLCNLYFAKLSGDPGNLNKIISCFKKHGHGGTEHSVGTVCSRSTNYSI